MYDTELETIDIEGLDLQDDETTEETTGRYKTIDINGILWPYRPATTQTKVLHSENGAVAEEDDDIVPPYINHLKSGNILMARISALREVLASLLRCLAFRADCWYGPVSVSAFVPHGCFFWDGERILVNEKQFDKRFVDADGDRAFVFFRDGKATCLFVKYPITMKPIELQRIGMVREEFEDCTIADIKAEAVECKLDEHDMFMKVHLPNTTGTSTNYWNTREAYESVDLGIHFATHALENPMRPEEVEGMLKISRSKDGSELEIKDPQRFSHSFVNELNWALCRAGRIHSMGFGEMRWILDYTETDILTLLDLIWNCEFDENSFQEAPEPGSFKGETHSKNNLALVPNLIKWGILRYKEIENPIGVPTIQIVLTRRQGEFVALTDIKRGSELSRTALLYPVFSGGEWVHPINFLQQELASFTGWVKKPEDLNNPITASRLVKAISNHIGYYGDMVSADVVEKKLVIRPWTKKIAGITVCIDYRHIKATTTAELLELMYEYAKNAEFVGNHRINLAGGKGNKMTTRKYVLAHENGVALYAKPQAHIKRPGALRSQLLDGAKQMHLRTLIVKGQTKSQFLITPTGKMKQYLDTVLMPKFSPTQEEEFTEKVDYYTLSGEHFVGYTAPAKEAIDTGKLVNSFGMKGQPREVEQYYTLDGKPIDLIIFLGEWKAKETLCSLLENGNLEEVHYTADFEETHKGVIWTDNGLDMPWLRTSNAGENTPAGFRRVCLKGVDSIFIRYTWEKFSGNEAKRRGDIEFSLALLEAVKQL